MGRRHPLHRQRAGDGTDGDDYEQHAQHHPPHQPGHRTQERPKYLINNGKTVQITTTWEYMGQEYSQTIRSLIVNRKNTKELGF
jgi:hypothetical protein